MNAPTQTYTDSAHILRNIQARFRRLYGWDPDDLESDVNWFFWDAYRTHDPEKGPWTYWLRRKVVQGLISKVVKQKRRFYRLKRTPDVNLEDIPTNSTRTGLESILACLYPNSDGWHLVAMIADCPDDLAALMEIDKKDGLWDHLLALGWSRAKIERTFLQVEEAVR